MESSANFTIDALQRDTALSAATWLPAFYPHVRVVVTEAAVELRSDRSNQDELAAIWSAALVNEVLLERGDAFRTAAFEALAP